MCVLMKYIPHKEVLPKCVKFCQNLCFDEIYTPQRSFAKMCEVLCFQAVILILLFYKQVLLFNFVYGTRCSFDG